jgi:hypothetical protein
VLVLHHCLEERLRRLPAALAVEARSGWPSASPTGADAAGGRWRALPPMPAQPTGQQPARRNGAAVVWTGQQLIVWGGLSEEPFRTRADGAAYHPGTGRWTPHPTAPESQWLREGHGAAMWTGREMLVWGGTTVPDPVEAPGRGAPPPGPPDPPSAGALRWSGPGGAARGRPTRPRA